jgi:vacuolar-type H+-ATPase subunit F/Vma7
MSKKMAIIGDSEFIFAFRALGMKTYAPRGVEEARAVLNRLEKEDIALCFVHESFLGPLEKDIANLRKKVFPVVVGFSDYRKTTDYLSAMMREMAIKATGSVSLVKGERDGTR